MHNEKLRVRRQKPRGEGEIRSIKPDDIVRVSSDTIIKADSQDWQQNWQWKGL
jgi:hypothetical protein